MGLTEEQLEADRRNNLSELDRFKEDLLEWISNNSGCSGYEHWSTVVVEDLEEFIAKERK